VADAPVRHATGRFPPPSPLRSDCRGIGEASGASSTHFSQEPRTHGCAPPLTSSPEGLRVNQGPRRLSGLSLALYCSCGASSRNASGVVDSNAVRVERPRPSRGVQVSPRVLSKPLHFLAEARAAGRQLRRRGERVDRRAKILASLKTSLVFCRCCRRTSYIYVPLDALSRGARGRSPRSGQSERTGRCSARAKRQRIRLARRPSPEWMDSAGHACQRHGQRTEASTLACVLRC
jgi:hypothetical protein